MDRELAGVVLERWELGYPISETQLYKAASALGIDPMAALIEARFYTCLDSCLLEKRAMSRGERIIFSAAAGLNDRAMTKTASAYGVSPDELILEALRERGFVPDVVKIAQLAMQQPMPPGGAPPPGGPPPGMMPPGMDPMAAMQGAPPMGPEGAMPPEQAAGDAMMAPPQEDAMVQQQPSARVKPSPTGPEQVAASDMGNLDELLQEGQQVFGDQAMQNGGTAPQGMPEPAPPPPSPEERIKQVGPNLDDETVARYAEQLQRFEEGFQMQIADPKQMVKFVKELQKLDGKKIDQGIKAMSEQLEQEQAQELGVDSAPTIDGPGGGAMGGPGKQMAPKPGGQEGPPGPGGGQAGDPTGNPQEDSQGENLEGQSMANAAESAPNGPPQQPPKGRPQPKGPPQQSPQEAVEKVANAARAFARRSFF